MSHNIINFLKSNKNKTIKESVIHEIASLTRVCQEKIGEGYFGKVYAPVIPNVGMVKLKNNNYAYMAVAVKELMHNGTFDFVEEGKTLYLYSDRELTCEGIILYFVSKFWYESKLPYAPFLISVHKCVDENTMSLIDHLVMERHGILGNVSVQSKGMGILTNGVKHDFSNKLETFYHLLEVGLSTCDNNYNFTIDMGDNKVSFNLVDMIDNILLHVLIYMDYCNEHGLTLMDQHLNNIFISWTGYDNKMVGEKSMLPVKNIYYKINKNEHIEAPIKNIIPKIGDVGSSVLKLRDDLWIIADLLTKDRIPNLKKMLDKYVPSYVLLLEGIKNTVPYDLFSKTIVKNIYDDNDVIRNNYSVITAYVELDKFPTEKTLLKKYFSKYLVSSVPKDDETVFIVKD